MSTAACPKCHDEVTLPPAAPRAAQVRCPWCREEFELSEVLDLMPPMLEVIGSPYAGTETRRDFQPEMDTADDEFNLAQGDQPAGSEPSFDFSGGGGGGVGVANPPAPAATRPRTSKSMPTARARRKEKSVVAEMIKVAVGGVVGLVLAQLILWWLPDPYQRDPIEIGPVVGKYVPFIVPKEFRPRTNSAGGGAGNGAEASGGTQVANDRTAPQPPRNTAGGNTPGFGESGAGSLAPLPALKLPPEVSGENPLQAPEAPTTPNVADNALEIPEPDLNLTPDDISLDPAIASAPSGIGETPEPSPPANAVANATTDDATNPPAEEPSTPDESATPSTPPDSPPTADPAAEPFVGVNDAPMYVRDEVNAALVAVQSTQQAWQDAAAGAEAEQEFYDALTDLAEKLTYADANDAKVAEIASQASGLLSQGNLRERAKLLVAQGPARLSAAKTDRPNNGIVLFGRVQTVEKQGDLYETRLEMPSAGGLSVTPVYSKHDPQAKAGTTIVVLGTLVDQPKTRLTGYHGGLPTVVWMGQAVALTK